MDEMGEFREAVARSAAGGSAFGEAAPGVRGAVLVEGPSDHAALEALARRLGRDLEAEGICVLSMGGATNVARYAELLGPPGLGLRLTGLCDEQERPFYDRALEEVFVCVKDLEEELIRALGVARVEEIVEAEGELGPWRTFTRQPAQRGRSPEQRMRRFLGTQSGRKIRYGRLLAGALDPASVPGPLEALIGRL
ncbi:TOPRIM nucleotidyl transferase/hydrolase domain-containing protein [Streptomyces sp. NPDC096033]|uniref:TOPRIM nucleotidyl transferase/hydrolase domain-containing protein n=1 Tax=Streptomyces sp. NPDC096033 TaxID=3366071 RepID=UPI003824B2BD